MVFRKVFECDNDSCKAQGINIYQVKVEVVKLMVGNGEKTSFQNNPKNFEVQVCGRDCALKEIDAKLKDNLAPEPTKEER